MKFSKIPFLLLAAFISIVSCEIAPQPINYGTDQCNFCKMNIVDKQHAAQYVTKKGKQFKFDAIECMVNDLSEKNEEEIGIFLVSDFGRSGEMTDALQATYLISEEIKSPMGAFLSSFSSSDSAKTTQEQYTGELFTWETLKQQLADK